MFDLQDIPDAMKKKGWPISAKCARIWFNSPKNIYNNKPNSIQPIDDTLITLDWALKFGNVREKYNELLSNLIYKESALLLAKRYVQRKLSEMFSHQECVNFSFNTAKEIKDIRKFHEDWQFQLMKLSTWDTMDEIYLTDLTGALGEFAIYVAIGNVNVFAERFYIYDNIEKTKTYSLEPTVEITHIYAYIKDNYSFNDIGNASQYLGHWNKRGMITTPNGLANEAKRFIYSNLNFDNTRKKESDWGSEIEAINKPVDLRRGIIKILREQDVYFPIYNRHYNQWREKHNQGGDFMLYSKPKYLKLKTPIKFKLDTICRLPEEM